jgi:hypothetical protein
VAFVGELRPRLARAVLFRRIRLARDEAPLSATVIVVPNLWTGGKSLINSELLFPSSKDELSGTLAIRLFRLRGAGLQLGATESLRRDSVNIVGVVRTRSFSENFF